jgi:hypothetical protein
MTNSLWSWNPRLIRRKLSNPPVPASGAPSAAGRPTRTTYGPVTAGISGTRSTREECARHASTSGTSTHAYRAASGSQKTVAMAIPAPSGLGRLRLESPMNAV